MLLAAASFSLVAAACGSDSNDEAITTDAPTATVRRPTDAEMDDMERMADGPFGPACSAVPTEGEGSFAGMTDDPAATAASNNPLLSTLVTAVSEAGLVDTLNSDGPFTIFAPVNDAFAAIPAADLDAVLADQELLTSILTYHVVAGERLDAAALGSSRFGRHRQRCNARVRRRRHDRQRCRRALLERDDRERHGPHHRRGADAARRLARWMKARWRKVP
jgi:uncharacterized surface protein with fasciclin (FAS1) repeats